MIYLLLQVSYIYICVYLYITYRAMQQNIIYVLYT